MRYFKNNVNYSCYISLLLLLASTRINFSMTFTSNNNAHFDVLLLFNVSWRFSSQVHEQNYLKKQMYSCLRLLLITNYNNSLLVTAKYFYNCKI